MGLKKKIPLPQKETSKLSVMPHFSLKPLSVRPLLIHLLSKEVCLVWTVQIKAVIHYMVFYIQFLSLSMFSRFILIIAYISTSFSLITKQSSIWLSDILSTYLSLDGHLGCFHWFFFFLVIMNIHVQDFSGHISLRHTWDQNWVIQ